MKDTIIVETFARSLNGHEVDAKDLKMSNDYIQELASNPNPNNLHELGEILSFVINDGLQERINYIDLIADVKQTGLNEKAQFTLETNDLQAMFQAKSGTTQRSRISTRNFSLETEEVSIRPVVNFLDLATGKQNLTDLAQKAAAKMESAIIKRFQDVIYATFKDSGDLNYATGAGIAKGSFDPILHAMKRAGGNATVLGDTEAISKFTELAGFGNVPDSLAVEHNQNGQIGRYLGSPLLQLNNPFVANSISETELRKDLIYVIPSVEKGLMPVKAQFEGGVQSFGVVNNIDSKEVEFRFDQYVGVGVVGARHLLGIYEDSTLSAE